MTRFDLTGKEIAERGRALYESKIRSIVETEENIGKMVIINVETGEYAVGETGLQESRAMQTPQNDAPLYGIRIGYRVSATIGGVMERVKS
jgi:hypothetical protein